MRDWRAYVREHLRLGELRPEHEAEIVEEIAQQLEDAYREARRQGLSEVEAEEAAGAHITDWESLSAALRESPAGQIPLVDRMANHAIERGASGSRFRQFFTSLWGDVLYALRLLRKNPGFAVAAVATLAIGIGANTAVFSIIDSTLFFPLPYPHSGRIVALGIATPHGFMADNSIFESWERRNKVLAAISADNLADFSNDMTLTGAGAAERLDAASITSGFFSVLGVHPMLGRAFLPSETRPGGPEDAVQLAILSYALWRDRFGAKPRIIGQAIHLNDKLYTVVGVMPKDFEFPAKTGSSPALFIPFNLPPEPTRRGGTFEMVEALGRLKPGVSAREAEASLEVILRQHIKAGRETGLPKGAHAGVVPLRDFLVGKSRTPLLVFWGAVGFLLLIACVNVANLALARAVAREKEIAVRVALGAHRRRVARQLLTENVLLATLGGLAGIAIAYAVVVLVRDLGPSDVPRLRLATVNLTVLGFTIVVAALAGILAGLAPVRAAWRLSTVEALKEGARTSAGRGHQKLRGALAVVEIAMALALAIGAGLLLRSFVRLTDVPLHFNPHNLLTAQIALPKAKYASPAQQIGFEDALLRGVDELPGVSVAAASNMDPRMWFRGSGSLAIAGQSWAMAAFASVSAGFFRAAGVRILKGRAFLSTDIASSQTVAIVNESFARRYFPHANPVGQKIGQGAFIKGWATIVGVAADFKGHWDPYASAVFLPLAQDPKTSLTLLIRTRGNPLAIVPALRAQVAELDSSLPVFDVATMDHLLGEQVATPRFNTLLLSAFALIALVLATLGVYGVISYSVSERTHEIGIRMAMGAEKGAVMRMIVGKTLALALIGVAIGAGGALVLTRYLQSLLYQIRPDDPWTFALAAAVLVGAALLAGFLPARRATEVDPISALRHE